MMISSPEPQATTERGKRRSVARRGCMVVALLMSGEPPFSKKSRQRACPAVIGQWCRLGSRSFEKAPENLGSPDMEGT
jgi:hypothetical protein